MKKVLNKNYCSKVISFCQAFGISLTTQDFFKKGVVAKKIKRKFLTQPVQNFKELGDIAKYTGTERELAKEFFPLKYENICTEYEEGFQPNVSDYQFITEGPDGKIRWAYMAKDRIFKKKLTQAEYTRHVRNFYKEFIKSFNKDFLQYGGFFLTSDGAYITDKNKFRDGSYRRICRASPDWEVER